MHRLRRYFCGGSLICASLTGAHAQHSVSVGGAVERIENPQLNTISTGAATVIRLAPNYTYELQEERTRSRFNVGGVVERSSNTALLASRDYPSLGYTWAYSWPTSNIELRANLAESATRNAELQELGRVTTDARERTIVTGAVWNQELTARTRLSLNWVNTRVGFDSALLRDYRQLEVSSRMDWELHERGLVYLEPTFARLTQSGSGSRSSQARLRAGLRTDLAPDWSLAAQTGLARTGGSASSTGLLGGLQLNYNGSRWSSGLEWAKDVAASGSVSGFVSTQTLGLRLAYRLTEGATLSAGATSSRSSGGTGGRGSQSSLILENQLDASWTSTLGVEDRRSKNSIGNSGKGWAVRAGMLYAYPGR